MRTIRTWLPALALLALTACPTPTKTETLELTPSALALSVGEPRAVSARVVSVEEGTVQPALNATWTSADESVATVTVNTDGTATVTGVGGGNTTVTVSLREMTATVSVIVTVPPRTLSSIELEPSAPSLAHGTSLQLTATGIFSDTTREDLTTRVSWRSSAESVLDVTQGGLVTGLMPGTATVTVALGNVFGNVSVTVTAATLARVEVTPPTLSLARGFSQALTATGVFTDATTQDLTSQVTWTTAAAAVATVSAAGVVTGVGGGTTAVRATKDGVTGEATVTVSSATIASIDVTPAGPSLPRGTTQQLTATARFSDNTTQDITELATWSSASPGVATVSNDAGTKGLVTARAQGTAEVSAAFADATGSTTVTVTAATLTRIEVTPDTATLAKGLTRTFTARGVYSDGATADLTSLATWSSSDPAKATISNAQGSYGLARALAEGDVTLTATRGGVSGTAALTVTAATLVSLAVTPTGVSVPVGLTRDFTATGTFTDGTTQNLTTQVTWEVTNMTASSISNAAGTEGRLTALAVGSTTVRAVSGTVTGTTTASIIAAQLVSIDVEPANPTVTRGSTVQLLARGRYTDNSTQVITNTAAWSSGTTTVATVTTTGTTRGLVTGVDPGTSVITATVGSVSGTTTVTVTAAALASISVTPANPTVAKGLPRAFTATGTYTDMTTADLTTQVTWTSGTMATATIGSDGVATTHAEGTSLITATLGAVSGSTTLTVGPPALVSIAVTAASTSLRRGDTLQLTATGTYTDSSTQDVTATATWSSTPMATLTVSNTAPTKGLASGVAVGTATATAQLGTVSGTLDLTVTPPDLVSITLTPANPSVTVGGTQAFVATGTYSDTTTQVLTTTATWGSSDETKATITTAGVATAVAVGTSTISAQVGAISGSTTMTVTAPVITAITVAPATPSVAKGRTQAFTATATYSDSSTGDVTSSVTWESSDETKVTIAPTGVATAVAEGSSTITARSGTVSGTATMTVTAPVLESLVVTGVTTLAHDDGALFVATGTMSDGTTPNLTASVTWDSSNATVATVSDAAGTKGAVHGLFHGDVTITATQGAISGSLNVRVRDRNAPAQTRCGPGLVISQVYGAGGNGGATWNRDFIELHNAGPVPVSLGGLSVQYASASGTSWAKHDLPAVSLLPGDYFLAAQASGGVDGAALTADATGTLAMAAASGKVALVNSTTLITTGISCPTSGIIDFVGYGSANCVEGTGTTVVLTATTSATRLLDGCRDTNSTSTDFVVGAVVPRSLATPGILCDCDATESSAPEEVAFCNLQHPPSMTRPAGSLSEPVYGRVYEDGVTQPAGADPRVRVQVGYGPSLSNPRFTAGWSWWPTRYNVQAGNDDEYEGFFVVPPSGAYSYTTRVSLDGVNWTACDLDGAGRDPGLTFENTQQGGLSVP